MIHRIAVIAVLIAGISVLPGLSQSNWSSAGLEGGVIKSMCVKSDGVLYAGTQRGVYISVDLASSWFKGGGSLDQFGITSVLYVNFMVFAVNDNGDFYASYDNGYNFSLRSSGYNIKTLGTFNQNIYAGLGGSTNNSGILLTTNFGVNWLQTNLPGSIVVNEIISDDVALYAATNNGVYTSYPVNTSWIKNDAGIPADTKVFSLKKSGSIILAATNRGIYRSTDNGASWNPANNGLTPGIPFFTVTIQGSVSYTCQFGRGVYKSLNYGDNWVPVQNGLNDNMISCFGVFNNYLFAGSAGGGVYLSVDNGGFWFSKNTGIEAHTVNAMYNIGSIMYAGTQGGGVFRSLNGMGTNWSASNNGLENTVIYSFAEGGGYLFAGTYGGVFKTVSGEQWEAVNTGFADSVILSLNYNGSYLFAGTQGGGIYRSSNLGAQWTKLSGIILNDTIYSLTNNGNVVYAATKRNGFVRSLDNGETWQAFNSGFFSIPYSLSMTMHNNEIYAGVFSASPYLGVFKYDASNNWQRVFGTLACYFVYSFSNNIVASFYNWWGGVIHLSSNSGTNWISISNSYTPNWGLSNVLCLRRFETHLYAGATSKSLWRIPLSQILSNGNIAEDILKDFKLGQNYPNPFNPVTDIPFELKESSHVLLKVYDVNGRLVKELINEKREAGKYSVDFDGSELSSGVYFYRIIINGATNNFTQTKNMLLLK